MRTDITPSVSEVFEHIEESTRLLYEDEPNSIDIDRQSPHFQKKLLATYHQHADGVAVGTTQKAGFADIGERSSYFQEELLPVHHQLADRFAIDTVQKLEYPNTSSLPTDFNMSLATPLTSRPQNKETTEPDNGGDKKTFSSIKTRTCEIRKNMKSEKDRLLTYVNWPNPCMDPKDLAKAGFYSTRYEDVVRCAFCDVEICRWEAGDNAMSDHQRWSNSCPFVRGIDVGNIPLDPNEKVEIPRASQDTCGRFGIEIRPNSVPERSEQSIDLNKLGITPNRSPAYPNYSTLEARLRSFKEWPLSIKQKPEELSDAGFFYTGKGDQTMCFSCGGGLKDWLEADEPWEQHARWFTKCSYVLMVKGRDFVTEVSSRLPAVMTAAQGAELRETGAEKPAAETKPTADEAQPAVVAPVTPAAEKKKVDDGRLCKICYTEELGVVFLPCGHIVACVKCAPSLSTCAVCRQPFTATVRAFLS